MNGRVLTVIVSVAVHGALALIALTASEAKHQHAATEVSVEDEQKKKQEPPKPPPPPPPPAPPKNLPPPPKEVKAAPPPPEETAPPPPVQDSAPQIVNQNYGNGEGTGPSIEVKKDLPKQEIPKAVKPPPKTVKLDKPPPAPPPVQDGVCTEPPGKPEPERKTEIEYTDEARAAGVEGYLKLEVIVDASGNVIDVKVMSSVDAQLDASAIATVKTWHFKPALACGKPVSGGEYIIGRKFELSD